MSKENLKQILLTILIGATINVITILSQFAIDWLNTIPAEIPGTVVGVAKYLLWVSKSHA